VHKVLGALLLLISMMPGLTKHTNTVMVLRFGSIVTELSPRMRTIWWWTH